MTEEQSRKGNIVSIQLCPGHRKPMRVVDEAEAVENLGLRNDMHALPDSSRQVLLIEQEILERLGLVAGQVKENITTKNIALMVLKRGDRLRLGNNVVLEVTKACSPCSRMEEIRAGLLKEIAGQRGMLAKVITGGTIRSGDAITLFSV